MKQFDARPSALGRGMEQQRLPARVGAWVVGAMLVTLASMVWNRAHAPEPLPPTQRDAAVPVKPAAAPRQAFDARAAAAQFLQFEPNRGQAPKAVRYVSRGPGHHVEVFDDGLALSAPGGAAAQLRFVGARAGGTFEAREPAPGRANYLIGANASQWVASVPRYRQLRYTGLYPGIDLVYYSRQGEMEFDLVVRPGADPALIRLHVGGAEAPVIAANGDLWLDGDRGALRLHRPVLYQNIDGQRRTLGASYVLHGERELGFALPAYDKRYPLIIDPVFKLLYSTYLGGVHDDQVGAMVLDAQNNAYVIGNSGSEDWPVSGNAYQSTRKAIGRYVRNLVVTKFDASGTLIYSTFLGGTQNDYGSGIAVDAAGNAYLTGLTVSPDFPVTANALQPVFAGAQSAYLAVLSPDGSALSYSSFYGGSGGSQAAGVALDASGNVVLAGRAGPGLPTTAGAYKPTLATANAGFVAKFRVGAAPQLLAASYYGVDNPDQNSTLQGVDVLGLALDASGAPWITGQAFTRNLPTTAGAVQAAPTAMSAGCAAGPSPLNGFAFVAKLGADLGSLAYATYLSGQTEPAGGTSCSEFGRAITLDAAGNVYVTGGTPSATFPTTAGALQPTLPTGNGFASYSSFLTKLRPDGGAILWSTYFGGNVGSTFPGASLVYDTPGNAVWLSVLTGGGSNYPISADAYQAVLAGGGSDAGIARFDAASGALQFSSYLGGNGADAGLAMAVDAGGNAFVAGTTNATNFPVTTNAFQAVLTPAAFDGSDWFFTILGSGTIGQVRPARGGNGGDVTLHVSGAGLLPGATARLVNGAQVVAAVSNAIGETGESADLGFALQGAAVGSYDLVIDNPDGTVLRKANAFTVDPGGRPQLWADVVVRPQLRTGVPTTATVTVGNTGSVDAYFTRLIIIFPASMTYTIPGGLVADDGVDYQSFAAYENQAEGNKFIPLVIPHLAAGQTLALPLQLTSTTDSAGLSIQALVRDAWFDNLADALAGIAQAKANAATIDTVCVQNPGKPYLRNCIGEAVNEFADAALVAGLVPVVDSTLPSTPTDLLAANGALRTALKAEAASEIQTSLLALLTGNSVAQTGVVRAQRLSAGSTERPFLWGAGAKAFLSTPWGQTLVGTVGGYVFGKGADALFNPKPVDPTKKPNFNYSTRSETACAGGKRTIVETYFYKNTSYTDRKTWTENCPDPKTCPRKPPGAGAGAGSSSVLTRAAALGAALAGRARPLAGGGSCPPPPPSNCEPDGNTNNNSDSNGGSGGCSGSGGSIDPNEKFGIAGDGSDAHFVRSAAALSYQIGFENQPTATLAAARVVVTDQLDPAKFDLSSLALGAISFGSTRIEVPPGLSSYSTVYKIDNTMSVRIQGSLDTSNGLLKWTFDTIDHVTRLAPSDPTLGFLPPDTDGLKGQGYVGFTIKPKAGAPDGTVWHNSASIVFDANAAIVTPTWTNTLDTVAPVSAILSLTPVAGGASFDVAWSGSDAGSGARSFTVFVSDNGGAFTPWKTGVNATSATYDGEPGHTYGFYVVATDGAGNVEGAKAAAERSIVAGDSSGGSGGGGGGGGGCTLGSGDGRDPVLPLLALLAAGVLARRRYRPSQAPAA